MLPRSAFGVYIHVPYCLQICPYCDFTKYELGKVLPPAQYVEVVKQEIKARSANVLSTVGTNEMNSIYFGGGTPSLLEPSLIVSILDELEKAGFRRAQDVEISIEIDPATCDQTRLNTYLEMGFTRFSVGAQTFNERLLKIAGRKHSSQDTVEILSMLKQNNVNYSFDLLFGLPTQTLEELRLDVATALAFHPSHLSAYNLTVPESHPMSVGRAPDEEQVEMFDLIETELAKSGIVRYEVSNFAKPGSESRHNLLYWTDQPYWGIGTSSHSYFPRAESAPWGTRFWNSPSLPAYEKEIKGQLGEWKFPETKDERLEILEKHQALTDFCHTSLRLVRGLDENALRLKFGDEIAAKVIAIAKGLIFSGHVTTIENRWALTAKGRVMANWVFEQFTFLKDEV